MDRIVHMIINQVIRQLVGRGVRAGIDRMGKQRQPAKRGQDPSGRQN